MAKEIFVSSSLINRIIPLTASTYEITDEEIIIKEGFMNRNTKTYRLNDLETPHLVESLYQRIIKVGTIYIKLKDIESTIVLKNIKNPEEVRQTIIKILDSKKIAE